MTSRKGLKNKVLFIVWFKEQVSKDGNSGRSMGGGVGGGECIWYITLKILVGIAMLISVEYYEHFIMDSWICVINEIQNFMTVVY